MLCKLCMTLSPTDDGGLWIGTLGGGLYRWQDEVTSTAAAGKKIDSYSVLNLFAGLRSANGRWDVSVWGRNVTDEQELALLAPNDFLGFVAEHLFGGPVE